MRLNKLYELIVIGGLVIDVRSEEAYKDRHIKGARSIPVEKIEARVSELPRHRMIVTYCS